MKRFTKVMLFCGLALMMAAPAMADYSLYGSVRMATYYQTLGYPDGVIDANGDDSDSDLKWELAGNSRIGGKFNTGDLSGRFEYGTGVNLRLLYGSWDFGNGTLTIGQDYTLYGFGSGEAAYEDNGSAGFGDVYDGRLPQIRVELKNGFWFAGIKNNAQSMDDGSGSYDYYLPKLAVGYMHDLGYLAYGASVAYQTYDFNDDSIDSYLAAFNWKTNAGAVALQGNLFYGQNLGDFGLVGTGWIDDEFASYGNGNDATTYGGYVQAAYQFPKFLGLAGVGYQSNDRDDYAEKDDQIGYFVQAEVPVADGFTIVPVVSYYDFMDDAAGVGQGDYLWAGIKWQMDF